MKHIKIFEQFDWDNDPFGEDSFGSSSEFEIGDNVVSDDCFFWQDGVYNSEKTSIKNKGYWLHHHVRTGGIIKSIDYCENIEGYTGQIIKLKDPYWPWFQTTNFRKR